MDKRSLINIVNQNGNLVVTSREVAENFEKSNSVVNRAIENLISETSMQNCTHLFIPSTYKDSYERDQSEYLLTRDGFSLLVMGFTGRKALDWKIKYIDAFNKMEEALKQQIPTMTQAELTAMIAQNQVEIERKAIQALEHSERTEKRLDSALNALASPPDKEWRQSMNTRLRGMCEQYQLNYPTFYGDLYAELETLARVDLESRQSRLRKRMLANGATKTACKAVTKLEIIERDPKLKPIFEGIVRKYQAKYALDWQEGIQ